jgi:c-di-GMP-related signal transduction protein
LQKQILTIRIISKKEKSKQTNEASFRAVFAVIFNEKCCVHTPKAYHLNIFTIIDAFMTTNNSKFHATAT